MAIEKIRGGGEMFKHPYTIYSAVQQFPFKFYWQHARYLRYSVYTAVLLFPLYAFLTKVSHAPANVKKWEEIRAKRHHTFFDLPHD